MSQKIKKHRFVTLTLRVFIGAIIFFVLWNPVAEIAFSLIQGQDSVCDMGDNYKIQSPAGNVLYIKPNEEHKWKTIIPERVNEFALKEPWFIGRTTKGWFAINKKTDDVYYPTSTLKQLGDMVKIDLSELELSSDVRPYLQIHPWTHKAMLRVKIVFLLFLLLFIFGPNIFGIGRLIFQSRNCNASTRNENSQKT